MSKIRPIRDHLKKIYKPPRGARGPILKAAQIPLPLQAFEWAALAQEYVSAASVLDREDGPRRPMLHMAGHAVECSLKACLVAVNEKPPQTGKKGHDLDSLYELAEKHGFQLDHRQLAMIVHLHHHCVEDLVTGTRYKMRYPATCEGLGGPLPDCVPVVRALIEQAANRIPQPFREMFDVLEILRGQRS
jgi:HEPN domain-containing protein